MFDWFVDLLKIAKDGLPIIYEWFKTAVQMLISSIVDIPLYTTVIPQPFGYILGISFCAIGICAYLRFFGSNVGGG